MGILLNQQNQESAPNGVAKTMPSLDRLKAVLPPGAMAYYHDSWCSGTPVRFAGGKCCDKFGRWKASLESGPNDEFPGTVSDVSGFSDVPDQLDLYFKWTSEFKPFLGKSERWAGFCYLMRHLLLLEAPVVVETGTLREPGNWKGDGQSTRVWQWLREHKKGAAVSVDQDAKACQLASNECDKVMVHCQDSVSFLRGFVPFKHRPPVPGYA